MGIFEIIIAGAGLCVLAIVADNFKSIISIIQSLQNEVEEGSETDMLLSSETHTTHHKPVSHIVGHEHIYVHQPSGEYRSYNNRGDFVVLNGNLTLEKTLTNTDVALLGLKEKDIRSIDESELQRVRKATINKPSPVAEPEMMIIKPEPLMQNQGYESDLFVTKAVVEKQATWVKEDGNVKAPPHSNSAVRTRMIDLIKKLNWENRTDFLSNGVDGRLTINIAALSEIGVSFHTSVKAYQINEKGEWVETLHSPTNSKNRQKQGV